MGFSGRDGETILAIYALGLHLGRRINRLGRFRDVIPYHTPRALPHGENWRILSRNELPEKLGLTDLPTGLEWVGRQERSSPDRNSVNVALCGEFGISVHRLVRAGEGSGYGKRFRPRQSRRILRRSNSGSGQRR